MFSSRRRVLGKPARTRLGMLGILGIAGLLAATGWPALSPAWLQPARSALAQSDTATPTDGLGEPPLTLRSSASAASAIAGEQLSLTTTIAANSVEPRAVELRANIDGLLELLGTSGGSCSGGSALSCKLSVQRGQPATIVVTVRVRPSATPGSQLVYQALAQDDLSNTAASDQVIVMIAPLPPRPTSSPDAAPSPTPKQSIPANGAHTPAQPTTIPTSRPAHSAPTAMPTVAANTVEQSTTAPATLALPIVPAANMHSPAEASTIATPADGAAPSDSWLELAANVTAQAQTLDQGTPAQEVPVPAIAPAAAPSVAVEPRTIVRLPNTATAPPLTGLMALLLGLALTFHGLRRVRRAAAQLERQTAALGRLAMLAGAKAQWRSRMRNDEH